MAQVHQARRYAEGMSGEDHTPGSDVTAGVPIEVNGRAAVAANDITASEKGAIQTKGLFLIVQKAEAISQGDDVWWDADGDPVGGTAGTGAATATPQTAAGDFYLGSCRQASVAADETVVVDLNAYSKGAAIADAADSGQTGSGAEQDALGAKINEVIAALEEAGIIDNQ